MFFLCLEQFKPMKYRKNAVGSFKNTVYRKSEKIEPRSDFWQIWDDLGSILGTFFEEFALFCEKNSVMKIIEKKVATRWKQGTMSWPAGSLTSIDVFWWVHLHIDISKDMANELLTCQYLYGHVCKASSTGHWPNEWMYHPTSWQTDSRIAMPRQVSFSMARVPARVFHHC